MRNVLYLLVTLVLSAAALHAEEPKSYYLIGNSLTWDTVPSLLDGDVQWHVDCGKSLPYEYQHPEKPCVKTSTLWPQALKEKQYDLISVQPHYGSMLAQDVEVISKWVEMQPQAVFVIHTGWARQATRQEEYESKDVSGMMLHSPAYFEALLGELRKRYPKREFRRTRAMDLLARIAADVEAGQAPLPKLEDLHRDEIHMNLISGRYLMHNAMRQALGQPASAKGFEKLDPKLKAYLDQVLAAEKK